MHPGPLAGGGSTTARGKLRFKVVHDDGNKKIQHLWGPQGPRRGRGEQDTSKHICTEAQRERGREIKMGKGSQRKRWGEIEERHMLTEGAQKQGYGEMEMGERHNEPMYCNS